MAEFSGRSGEAWSDNLVNHDGYGLLGYINYKIGLYYNRGCDDTRHTLLAIILVQRIYCALYPVTIVPALRPSVAS
jgi:hypothetical protein